MLSLLSIMVPLVVSQHHRSHRRTRAKRITWPAAPKTSTFACEAICAVNVLIGLRETPSKYAVNTDDIHNGYGP